MTAMNVLKFPIDPRSVSASLAYGAIGEVCGHIIWLYIPHTGISGDALGHLLGAFFGAVAQMRLFKTLKSNEVADLNHRLLDIEQLYAKNTISADEKEALRTECIKGFKNKLKV